MFELLNAELPIVFYRLLFPPVLFLVLLLKLTYWLCVDIFLESFIDSVPLFELYKLDAPTFIVELKNILGFYYSS